MYQYSVETSVDNRQNILLDFVSPALYRGNAFRISGLPIDASPRDISRRIEKLTMLKKYGGKTSDSGGGLIALKPPPEDDEIREAIQRLGDPERRIIDELFWFWPEELGASKTDKALQALANDRVKDATDTWQAQEKSSANKAVSIHNLAVLAHLGALDLEFKRRTKQLTASEERACKRCWKEAYSRWKELADEETFWQRFSERIHQLDDPRLTRETIERLKSAFPLALLSINAGIAVQSAEQSNNAEMQRHLAIMRESGFPEHVVNQSLQNTLAQLRDSIKTLCASADTDDPLQALKQAEQLISQTKHPLYVLQAVLPETTPLVETAHDKVALVALANTIQYANHTEDWYTVSDIMTTIAGIALSESARRRIKKNADIFQSNIEYNTCFFCKENPREEDASININMHGNIQRNYYLNQITWNHTTVNIPRCSQCEKSHNTEEYWVGGGFAGGLLGIGACTAIVNTRAISDGFGFIAFALPIIIGIILGIVISKKKRRPGSKKYSSYHEYDGIQELKAKGWQYGERPA